FLSLHDALPISNNDLCFNRNGSFFWENIYGLDPLFNTFSERPWHGIFFSTCYEKRYIIHLLFLYNIEFSSRLGVEATSISFHYGDWSHRKSYLYLCSKESYPLFLLHNWLCSCCVCLRCEELFLDGCL